MNADRLKLVLDNYAAHFADSSNTPCADLLRAAAQCQAHFDLAAPDLAAMLRAAFQEAVSLLNYAGSVQPLNGLLHLAEQLPEQLRAALTDLMAEDGGDIDTRQVRMQRFAETCNELLHLVIPGKRSFEQNVRSAMAVLAIVKPGENYLYKSTEARAFADMLGFGLDVTAGSAFRVGNYYALGDALVAVIRRHESITALLPDADEAAYHLLVYELIMNAPAAKWGLFGDLTPLIKSRSRAGQANQERAQRINRMQMEIALMRGRAEAIGRQIGELPEPELVGQRFRSSAFGLVEAIRQEPGRLTVLAAGAEKRMALPMSILQGFLMPEDAATRERYEQERQLINQKRSIENDVRNRETEVQRLQSKP